MLAALTRPRVSVEHTLAETAETLCPSSTLLFSQERDVRSVGSACSHLCSPRFGILAIDRVRIALPLTTALSNA